tara:strand:- start:1299 stop:1574 length:276 start_codon:yes stop_codon:yes gene_type:complete
MKFSKKQKSLSQPVIDLLSRMSKLVDDGLTPEEAVEYMTDCEPEWRCGKGYPASKGGLRQAKKRLERRLEMMREVNNGVTTFINHKPQSNK